MREIKFRCWDGERMWYPETKSDDNNYTILNIFSNPESIVWGLYESRYGNRICTGEYDKLMQFTGLKDSKGTDIYEGDIIKMRYGKARVYWNETVAAWYIEFDIDSDLLWHYTVGNEECEVIGNIYENPSLIPK